MLTKSLSIGLVVLASAFSKGCPGAVGAIIVAKDGKSAEAVNLDIYPGKSLDVAWLVTSLYETNTAVSVGCFSLTSDHGKLKKDRTYYNLLKCKAPAAEVSDGKPGYIECELREECTNQSDYEYKVLIGGKPAFDPEIRVKGGRPSKGPCPSDSNAACRG